MITEIWFGLFRHLFLIDLVEFTQCLSYVEFVFRFIDWDLDGFLVMKFINDLGVLSLNNKSLSHFDKVLLLLELPKQFILCFLLALCKDSYILVWTIPRLQLLRCPTEY